MQDTIDGKATIPVLGKIKIEASTSGDGWAIVFNTKYIAGFLSVHGGAAKRGNLRIVWKFGREKSQTDLIIR